MFLLFQISHAFALGAARYLSCESEINRQVSQLLSGDPEILFPRNWIRNSAFASQFWDSASLGACGGSLAFLYSFFSLPLSLYVNVAFCRPCAAGRALFSSFLFCLLTTTFPSLMQLGDRVLLPPGTSHLDCLYRKCLFDRSCGQLCGCL